MTMPGDINATVIDITSLFPQLFRQGSHLTDTLINLAFEVTLLYRKKDNQTTIDDFLIPFFDGLSPNGTTTHVLVYFSVSKEQMC